MQDYTAYAHFIWDHTPTDNPIIREKAQQALADNDNNNLRAIRALKNDGLSGRLAIAYVRSVKKDQQTR